MFKADVFSKSEQTDQRIYPQIMRETMMKRQEVKKTQNERCTACLGIGKK